MLTCKSKAAGFFRLRKRKESGEVTWDSGWNKNLITDSGLNLMATNSNWAQTCIVGTGNSIPVVSNSQLDNQIAIQEEYDSDDAVASGESPFYVSKRVYYRFDTGDAAGNLSEIGICNSRFFPSSGALFSRSLIKDGNGNPTTITVLSDEILEVDWEVRFYAYEQDVVDTIDINGTLHTVTIRPCNIGSTDDTGPGMWISSFGYNQNTAGNPNTTEAYEAGIGTLTGVPAGLGSDIHVDDRPYVADSFEVVFDVICPITAANFATGIGSLAFKTGSTAYQVGFDPKIPKTSSDEFSFAFTHRWGRL